MPFPTFWNGNGNEKIIPNFREREWEAGIPGNGREREFLLTPGVFACRFGIKIQANFSGKTFDKNLASFNFAIFVPLLQRFNSFLGHCMEGGIH